MGVNFNDLVLISLGVSITITAFFGMCINSVTEKEKEKIMINDYFNK